jgi:4-amino-4-deoxy-L-arabinose transferase-like glycosyltransferase
MTFVSSSVNPDALVVALWTLVAWLGVKALKRGLTPRVAVALGGLTGAALITKASALVLVPPVLAAVAVAGWRSRGARAGNAAVATGLAVTAMVVPFAVWTVASSAGGRSAYGQASEVSSYSGAGGFNVRQFASYLWQFYLPRLPSMQPVQHQIPVISNRPAVNLWLGTGSAVFGWVSLWFPKGVYWAIGAALVLVALLFAAASARWWRRTPGAQRGGRLLPAAFLAAIGLLTIAGLHYTDYSFYASQRGLFMQGRYLLPLAGVLAAVVGFALSAVPQRLRPVAAGVWLGALLTLQVASLGLVLGRWYA